MWTSSTTTSVSQDPKTNKWHITVKRNGTLVVERKFIVNHLIFATGFGGIPKTPTYPGMVSFSSHGEKMTIKRYDFFRTNLKGRSYISSQHKKASDHQGKKVVVVGACTSGFESIDTVF